MEEKEKFILAGVHRSLRDYLADTTDESIDELGELLKTAGGVVVAGVIQNKPDLEAGTYMGEGKLEEIKQVIETLEADCIVFDDELSPVQMRNISDILGIKVLARSMLILDIFALINTVLSKLPFSTGLSVSLSHLLNTPITGLPVAPMSDRTCSTTSI